MTKKPNYRNFLLFIVLLVGLALPIQLLRAQEDDSGGDAATNGSVKTKVPMKPVKTANLRFLNKLTLEITEDKMNVGSEKNFGKLKIKLVTCYRAAGGDAEAFLQIWDGGKRPKNPNDPDTLYEKNAEGQLKIFSGWMFSSSPSLNALDHSIYDVWLVGCN